MMSGHCGEITEEEEESGCHFQQQTHSLALQTSHCDSKHAMIQKDPEMNTRKNHKPGAMLEPWLVTQ